MTIDLFDVRVTHEGRTLVDVPRLQLSPGEAVTIVGESGSGKSLLAHALMGSLPHGLHAAGEIDLGTGRATLADARARRRLWGRRLALLPQEPVLALDPTMRVHHQVAEGHPGFPRGRRGRAEALGKARSRLTELGLGGSERAYPHTFSGGMAQRAAFAAATIGGAEVLIADEPSKGLDADSRDRLARLLTQHVGRGGSLLTITHDLDLARALGGTLLVMRQASVVEQGPTEQVLAAPAHPWTRRLLAAQPHRWNPPWLGTDPGGFHRTALVEGTGLTKAYRGRPVFTDLDLTVTAGERISLTGPSGCGKTTLGNVLLRPVRPDAGEVRHHPDLAGGRAQKLYQDPSVSFAARVPIRAGLRDVVRRHRADPARVEMLLDRRPGEVSGGELQRLAIVRAALVEPRVVLADEPTSRLDLLTQEETVHFLMDQVAQHDAALVLVTHDLDLAAAVADRHVSLDGADVGSSDGKDGTVPALLSGRNTTGAGTG